MSNRGNPDYYKAAGTATGAPDLAAEARHRLAEQHAEEAHRPHQPTGPESTPLHLPHPLKKPRYKKRRTW